MSVFNQPTLRNNPEDGRIQIVTCRKLFYKKEPVCFNFGPHRVTASVRQVALIVKRPRRINQDHMRIISRLIKPFSVLFSLADRERSRRGKK
jgi:hypothetical protein